MRKLTLEKLIKAFKMSWSKDTCYISDQDKWPLENPAFVLFIKDK